MIFTTVTALKVIKYKYLELFKMKMYNLTIINRSNFFLAYFCATNCGWILLKCRAVGIM